MSETETRTQIVLARLAAGIAAVLLVLGLVWYGTSAETYPRIWTDIVDRPGGPMWPGEMLIIAVLLAFIPYLLVQASPPTRRREEGSMAAASAGSLASERTDPIRTDETLFENAPPMAVQRRLGLVKPGNLNVKRRALLVVLLAWLPLVVLVILQSFWTRTDEVTSLLWETGVHARYLIAAPLLVFAEAVCAPQLNVIARHFIDSDIVGDRDRGSLEDEGTSTRRLLGSPTAEVLVIVLAYLVAVGAAWSHAPDQLPAWAKPVAGVPRYSLAGWWHMLVSLPLLLVLIFGWFWRLAVWTRLLWGVSRLDLRLVASHPDHCAGLAFLGHSVRAFAIVGMALSAIVAGRSAHIVLESGGLPTQHFHFNIGLLVTMLALFVTPLLVFTPPMLRTWQNGTLQYGALADHVGHAFEEKWLGTQVAGQDALERPDFSATTDLYQIVSNVHAIRFVPINLKDLIVLVLAMLLPFVPVVLLAFPLDVIWAQIKSLLF
jgi:hypothetical protein